MVLKKLINLEKLINSELASKIQNSKIENNELLVEISDNDGSADQHRPLNADSFALQYLKVLKDKNLILEFRNSKIKDIRNSITIIKRKLQ